jgi:GNAT acetyltransferase-like protein
MKVARLAAIPKNRIVKFLRRYFAPAALVEGRLKGSTQDIRCLYVGEANFQRYLFGIMFDGSARLTRSWQAHLPRLRETFSREDFDIGIALIPKQYEPALRDTYHYRATKNVRQVTCISAPWEALTRSWRNYSDARRKIRKAGLEYRVSHDLDDLNEFYHQMFLPHIRKQYGSRAYLDDYGEFRRYFEKGFLILVEERGRPIAGGLCAIEGDTLVYYRAGVLRGSDEYVKKGAQAAIYYSMLLYARENRLAKVNFIMSHAFINDGVYRHKAGWGAGVSPDDKSPDSLLYFVPQGNLAGIAFFQNNPALVLNDQGSLDVLTGWTGNGEELPAIRQRILHAWAVPGLRSLQILTREGKEIAFFPSSEHD